ncbi:hypothetical protein ZWY2020_056626 [Hordeum vulgare]|nr:hypothetical protein ZWY2020_056626 [Hordeum vulgare]
MTKGQTSKMEARKKKGKVAAPGPAGHRRARWIQGDFLPSTVTEGDLLQLVEHGVLVHKSWRLPAEDEVEPAPREGSTSCSSAMSTEVFLCPRILSSRAS